MNHLTEKWLAGGNLKGRSAKDRIMAKVIVDHHGCWLYGGRINTRGYGTVRSGRQGFRADSVAHRVMYEETNGPIADGLFMDHLCRVTECVNPAHLEAVTHRTNVLRGISPLAINAAKKACVHGHEFTAGNTYVRVRQGRLDGRECRACNRAAVARYQARLQREDR